jgi:enediyne polyketide synthase
LDRQRPPGAPKPDLLLHARELRREGDTFHYDVRLVAGDGQVLETWSDLRLRRVETIRRRRGWPARLLANHVERRMEELMDGVQLEVALERLGAEPRERRSLVAIGRLLGQAAVVRHRPDGKPELEDGRAVSLAHAGERTMAVVGPAPLGCDLEWVSNRAPELWKDLLGADRLSLAQGLMSEAGENLDSAATRVWTAVESIKKAEGATDVPLVLDRREADGWVIFRAGKLVVGTLVTQLKGEDGMLALGLALGERGQCG